MDDVWELRPDIGLEAKYTVKRRHTVDGFVAVSKPVAAERVVYPAGSAEGVEYEAEVAAG